MRKILNWAPLVFFAIIYIIDILVNIPDLPEYLGQNLVVRFIKIFLIAQIG